jgi:hypothetical protein
VTCVSSVDCLKAAFRILRSTYCAHVASSSCVTYTERKWACGSPYAAHRVLRYYSRAHGAQLFLGCVLRHA